MHPNPNLANLIDLALAEDIGNGDLTTQALFSLNERGQARIVAREPLIVSGLEIAKHVFLRLDNRCQFNKTRTEGYKAKRSCLLLTIKGPMQALLSGERTALNFLRHLSGIATNTGRYVSRLRGTKCILLDTRKTTPGLRILEKAAVKAGGGHNHRIGLFDGIMIKDNHIVAAGSIKSAVSKTRRSSPPTVKIEVECDNLKQVSQALSAGADIIMLDNMNIEKMTKAVKLIDKRALTEASGNITIENIREVAMTGVDFISVGALTHSSAHVDISMELDNK
jgi:nicotinate-nucleotide pyrophosphorylase (carboxylating)